MIELNGGKLAATEAYKDYMSTWEAFLKAKKLSLLEKLVKPTTFSWKVASKSELFTNLAAVAEVTEQVHIGTVDNRFIASVVLKNPMEGQLYILKILERRPGSNDPLGLDSIDFLCPQGTEQVMQMLTDVDVNVVKENNTMHDWVSLRFGHHNQFEAKFTDHLVLSVAIKELHLAQDKLIEGT